MVYVSTQAFVRHCDSVEAIINSPPMLSYPPSISLNTHRNSDARTPQQCIPPRKGLNPSLPECVCKLYLNTHTHVCTHIALIRIPLSIIHVYFLPMSQFALVFRRVFVFVKHHWQEEVRVWQNRGPAVYRTHKAELITHAHSLLVASLCLFTAPLCNDGN